MVFKMSLLCDILFYMEKEYLTQELGKKVHLLRREKNLTQQELGDLAHISYKYIGEIERAEKNPSIGVLNRIANALGIGLQELIDFEPAPTESKNDAGLEITKKIMKELRDMKNDDLSRLLKLAKILKS